LKLISGNPGKRPLNVAEPVPPPMKDYEPPVELTGDVFARSVWERLVPDLAAGGLARSVDWPALVRYCLKFSRWIYLGTVMDEIRAANVTSRGSSYVKYDAEGNVDKVIEFPWVKEWRELDRELRLDEARLGIAPGSRSRIMVPEGKAKTEEELRRDFFSEPANYLVGDGDADSPAGA